MGSTATLFTLAVARRYEKSYRVQRFLLRVHIAACDTLLMDNTHRDTETLDTIQSGITDAYEALCELADTGDNTAAAMRDVLAATFDITTVSVRHRLPAGLNAYTRRTVVGAIDAMREQPERDEAPFPFDMDAGHAAKEGV